MPLFEVRLEGSIQVAKSYHAIVKVAVDDIEDAADKAIFMAEERDPAVQWTEEVTASDQGYEVEVDLASVICELDEKSANAQDGEDAGEPAEKV